MFNNKVIDVLTQLSGVTNSVILKHPKTVALSESQDIMILIDISKLDEEKFADIGFRNSLGDFLNIIKLFPEERDISIDGNTIQVSHGEMSSSFIVDNIALMDAYDRSPDQFDKTEEVPSVATFDISVDDIKNLKSATGVFKDLSEVLFTSKDGDVTMSLGATNKFNAKSNKFSVTKPAQTSKEFEIKIPVDNFKMLPLSEYQIDVKYNSGKDSYRILMSNKSLEGFKIMMSVKV